MNRKLRRTKMKKKAILELIRMGGLDESVVEFFDRLMENGCPESAIWMTLMEIATKNQPEEKQESKKEESGKVIPIDKSLH